MAEARGPRLVALDWGVAETLVALGCPPVGAAEIADYNRTVMSSAMPADVIDVGLRLSPNPELMQTLAADIVLINPAQAYMRPILEPFGQVVSVPIYTGAGQPYSLACAAALTLAGLAKCGRSAETLIAQADTVLAEAQAKLKGYDGAPVWVVSFIDARHVTVFGAKSLFQGVMEHLGLRNAWSGGSNEWGIALAGIEALAAVPDARLLYLTPIPEEAKRTLRESALWSRLPFVRDGRVHTLPPVWPFGALPSAMRIARLLGEVLTAPGRGNG